jgi:hypothetical protein
LSTIVANFLSESNLLIINYLHLLATAVPLTPRTVATALQLHTSKPLKVVATGTAYATPAHATVD